MAERAYCSHLSLEAAGFVVSLSKRRQRKVQISDYQTTDAAGRMADNLLVDGFLFTYWVDHASCEVRVSEIIAV